MASSCEVEFSFDYKSRGESKQLKASLPIPYEGNIRETAARLMTINEIPSHLFEEELVSALGAFISEETRKWRDRIGDDAILKAFEGGTIDKQVNEWVSRYTHNHAHFTTLKKVPDDPFPSIYLQLVHSPALTTLLQLEHTYSLSMNDISSAARNAVTNMHKKHDKELENMLQKTDTDVNKLMRQHVFEKKELEDKWMLEINEQQNVQKREYRDWLSRLHEELYEETTTTGGGGGGKKQKSRKKSALAELQSNQQPMMIEDVQLPNERMEESFTIYLGAQQKSSHSLRLICSNIISYCTDSRDPAAASADIAGSMRLNPRRIETAVSLYSTELTALILNTDREINTISGLKEVFADCCRLSTDFHFPSIDEQLLTVQGFATEIKETRETMKGEKVGGDSTDTTSPNKINFESSLSNMSLSPDRSSANSSLLGSLSNPGLSPKSVSSLETDEGVTLEPGDFYITRHSNLSQVHVICHLVSDDKAILNPSLNTRHPIMLGLRNILRTLARNRIHKVIIPLLLTDQMKPDMTINWCLKRAELVFKSVKGFLLESTTWQSDQTWTVQFLLPEGISDDGFEQISDLLSKTYRTSISRSLSGNTSGVRIVN
ncbi:PREDICTED: protein C12orf4 homolog [Amphimedon queenslandica]|uniref:Macro domain-containing protein n=1 Tax=Amphimedon queenslandica TaxID=400682 RepID=A0A1X7U9X3_AMPQE|nr:PREDICTED: protein C12orf4 homolog [Amphimedon queenslandica]|eukprot:XP_019855488.1 PREDICTED: protein C12orf4 homolog [Amphimedon queenslandica]